MHTSVERRTISFGEGYTERGGKDVHDADASCRGGEGGKDTELEDGEEEAVAEDELDGLPGDDEPHQQLHQAKHHRRFSYLVTGAPSSPHQTLALPSFQIAGNRGDGEESRHDVREPTIGRGGLGGVAGRGGAEMVRNRRVE